ncbi:MAG: hypothetical protein WKF82_12415 [Nocardioidaceae bacterium]
MHLSVVSAGAATPITEQNAYHHPRGHIECRACRAVSRKDDGKQTARLRVVGACLRRRPTQRTGSAATVLLAIIGVAYLAAVLVFARYLRVHLRTQHSPPRDVAPDPRAAGAP